MVKIEPITPPQPPTKLEFLEYLDYEFGYEYGHEYGYEYGYEYSYEYSYDYALLAEYNFEPTLADLETSPGLLEWFEQFQSEEMREIVFLSIFEEYFNGDWRSGQEFHKVVITQRLYQTSSNSTQA